MAFGKKRDRVAIDEMNQQQRDELVARHCRSDGMVYCVGDGPERVADRPAYRMQQTHIRKVPLLERPKIMAATIVRRAPGAIFALSAAVVVTGAGLINGNGGSVDAAVSDVRAAAAMVGLNMNPPTEIQVKTGEFSVEEPSDDEIAELVGQSVAKSMELQGEVLSNDIETVLAGLGATYDESRNAFMSDSPYAPETVPFSPRGRGDL